MSRISRANGLTRQEILTSIKRHGAMTAEELGNELSISQVAVRQHLASMEAESIVVVSVERRGIGRPSHRYRLTDTGDETFPRRYDALAQTLLDELSSWQGENAIPTLMARHRERVAQNLKARLQGKSLPAKVKELAQIENENGYMAEAIEAGSSMMRLIKHNCAYCAVARNHPDICCAGKIALYQEVLGNVEIVRETYILNGDNNCSFRIRDCHEGADTE